WLGGGGSVPVALIEHVFRFFFLCWIEHCQARDHLIAQSQITFRSSPMRDRKREICTVCNCIAPLAESLIVFQRFFPRFLGGIDIVKVGEIEVKSSERAPNPHIYKPRPLQLRPIEVRALQLRGGERRALQLRRIELRALQLRSIERRALQLRPSERRALKLRP